MRVHGHEVMPLHRPLAKYTGESLGMQYLFDQTGLAMIPLPDPNQLDEDVDEGLKTLSLSRKLLSSMKKFELLLYLLMKRRVISKRLVFAIS